MNTIPYVIVDDVTGVVVASGEVQEADFANLARPGCTVYRLAGGHWQKRQKVVFVDGQPVLEDDTGGGGGSIQKRRERMLILLARRRAQIEAADVNVGAIWVPNTPENRWFFASAARRAIADSSFNVTFKQASGWAALLSSQIIAIDNALFNRTARCNARESEFASLIAASQNPESLTGQINQFFTDEAVAVPTEPPPAWVG